MDADAGFGPRPWGSVAALRRDRSPDRMATRSAIRLGRMPRRRGPRLAIFSPRDRTRPRVCEPDTRRSAGHPRRRRRRVGGATTRSRPSPVRSDSHAPGRRRPGVTPRRGVRSVSIPGDGRVAVGGLRLVAEHRLVADGVAEKNGFAHGELGGSSGMAAGGRLPEPDADPVHQGLEKGSSPNQPIRRSRARPRCPAGGSRSPCDRPGRPLEDPRRAVVPLADLLDPQVLHRADDRRLDRRWDRRIPGWPCRRHRRSRRRPTAACRKGHRPATRQRHARPEGRRQVGPSHRLASPRSPRPAVRATRLHREYPIARQTLSPRRAGVKPSRDRSKPRLLQDLQH